MRQRGLGGHSRRNGESHMYSFPWVLLFLSSKVTQVGVLWRKPDDVHESPCFIPRMRRVGERGGRLSCAAGPAAVSWRRPPPDGGSDRRSAGTRDTHVAGLEGDVLRDITERLLRCVQGQRGRADVYPSHL